MKRIALLLLLLIGCSTASLRAQSLTERLLQLAGAAANPSAEQQQPVVEKSYPTANELSGSWTYAAPSIEYVGNDLLASIAVNGLKSEIAAAYVKAGLESGKGTITFQRRGRIHISMAGHEIDGSYSYTPKTGTLQLTLVRGTEQATFVGQATLADKVLTLQFDANDAIRAAQHASQELAQNANLKSIGQLLSNYPGIMLGGAFKK